MKKTDANGVIYDGEVNSSSEPHGKGTKTYPNGDFYEGEWKNGKLNGHGICVIGKERYNGDFANDCFEGVGTYKYKNGALYSGEWKADKWHGEGILSLSDGTVIECEWKNGKILGEVSIEYPDGTTYQGRIAPAPSKSEKDYIDGKVDFKAWLGVGYCVLSEDNMMSGATLRGVWSGYMKGENITCTSKDGKTETGRVDGDKFYPTEAKGNFDKLFDNTSLVAPSSDEYEGETNHRGEYHGKGVLRCANGEVYSGEFAYGEWYGYGLYVSKEGVTYYGYFTKTKESNKVTLLDGIKIPVQGKMKGGKFIPNL